MKAFVITFLLVTFFQLIYVSASVSITNETVEENSTWTKSAFQVILSACKTRKKALKYSCLLDSTETISLAIVIKKTMKVLESFKEEKDFFNISSQFDDLITEMRGYFDLELSYIYSELRTRQGIFVCR